MKGNPAYLTRLQFSILRKTLWLPKSGQAKVFDATYWRQAVLQPTLQVHESEAKAMDTIPGDTSNARDCPRAEQQVQEELECGDVSKSL
eukprot:4565613-Amphidinium_carterae.3